MQDDLIKEYNAAVHKALERCQFIEETLRVHIHLSIRLAKLMLRDHLPLRFTGKDLSKLPLGRLVSIFSHLNDNADLIGSLRTVTKDRNYVAHQSLLFTIGEITDSNHMADAIEKMNHIEESAREIHNALLDMRYSLHRSIRELEVQHGKKSSH